MVCMSDRCRIALWFASLTLVSSPCGAGAMPSANPADAAAAVRRIVAHRGASAERPENTLAAFERAIALGATVVEMDVRRSTDGQLFLLHDSTLDRTTDGTGPAAARTWAELKRLDAGGWFAPAYRGQTIPTLREALTLCRGKVDVLLDLKESSQAYAEAIAQEVRAYGDPRRTILGVHSPEEARRYRSLLPQSPQLGFISTPRAIEAFAEAGVETIRLWAKWLDDTSAVQRVHQARKKLMVNVISGKPQEVLPVLQHRPHWLLTDDPAAVRSLLDELKQHHAVFDELERVVEAAGGTVLAPCLARPQAVTFLNRDYKMLELPEALDGQGRFLFHGGSGNRVVLQFRQPAVVVAAFEYNTTGAWSFDDGRPPRDFGWQLLWKDGYRGTSNAQQDGQPHYASVYGRYYQAGSSLDGLPAWWVCLAVMDERRAAERLGSARLAALRDAGAAPAFSYSRWATQSRALAVPEFDAPAQLAAWQHKARQEFRRRLVFRYPEPPTMRPVGEPRDRGAFTQEECEVHCAERRLFRFYRLVPKAAPPGPLRTIVCFMGHGKVRQILDERDSYQHACAAQLAERGYLVFAMENVGMEPTRDIHHELDRILRLDGYGWYSLLFAHELMLLDHVFSDRRVDQRRVGVTGVSTGGLLALVAAAMEPRVAAASVQGIFGSMRVSFIRDRRQHCGCGAIPGLLPQFDLPELAMMVAPRPLHISNAARDGFRPSEALRCLERISPLYRRAGGAAPEFTQPPGGHEFAVEPAFDFFTRTLGKPRPEARE